MSPGHQLNACLLAHGFLMASDELRQASKNAACRGLGHAGWCFFSSCHPSFKSDNRDTFDRSLITHQNPQIPPARLFSNRRSQSHENALSQVHCMPVEFEVLSCIILPTLCPLKSDRDVTT
jgi:hypothetical protein